MNTHINEQKKPSALANESLKWEQEMPGKFAYAVKGSLFILILGGALMASIIYLPAILSMMEPEKYSWLEQAAKTGSHQSQVLEAIVSMSLKVAVLTLMALAFLWMKMRNSGYRIEGNSLLIRRGLLKPHILEVPKSHIKNIEMGPPGVLDLHDRKHGLVNVYLFPKKTTAAVIKLHGLPRSQAEHLKQWLKR